MEWEFREFTPSWSRKRKIQEISSSARSWGRLRFFDVLGKVTGIGRSGKFSQRGRQKVIFFLHSYFILGLNCDYIKYIIITH